MKHRFVLYVTLFFVALAYGHVSYAQFNTPLPTSIDVAMDPQTPQPYDTVQVTLSSYSTDINAATISWKINGATKNSGTGQKAFSFTVGAMNSTTNLEIDIDTQEGDHVVKTYNIHPTSVDFIWQAIGYTPPFYKGKTLFSYQDIIEFITLPHIANNGSEISTKNLTYLWTRDGSVVADFSGYGKSNYSMLASLIARPIDMRVDVTSPTVDAVGMAETTVAPVDPQVVLYEKDPLYGIQFQKALTNTVTLNGMKEIQVVAEPFYFGTDGNGTLSGLSYNWNINNSSIDSDTSQTSRIFRQVSDNAGTSFISLSITSAQNILQSASQGFNLIFGNSTQTAPTF